MSDMYNFDNNNYNNENHDGFNHYEFDENNNTPNHKKPNAKMVKFAKKVGAIALSAVLFGGVAAGSYQGVNALFGTSTDRGTGNDINKEQSSENNFQHNFKGYDGCDRHCKIRNAFYRFYHKQISSGSGKLFRNVRRT